MDIFSTPIRFRKCWVISPAAEKTRSPIKQIFQEDNNLSEQKRVRKMIRENKKMLRNANLIQNMVLHELPILEEDLPAAIILDDSF